MERGIVVGSQCSNDNGGLQFDGSVNSKELPKWLLYWDYIKYAGVSINGGMLLGMQSQDVHYLASEGIFSSHLVSIANSELPQPMGGFSFGGLAPNQYPYAHSIAIAKLTADLNNTTDLSWAIGQSGTNLLTMPGSIKKDLIDLQFVNALPSPAPNTSFPDIIDFKRKYPDELLRFRLSLDKLREKVLSSCDEKRSMEAVLNEISSSLEDIHKALKGSSIHTINQTISLYTENPSIGFWSSLSGIAGADAAESYEIPFILGGALGLAIPTVCKFTKRAIIGGNNLPDSCQDFAYVYHAIKELR